MKTTNKSHGLSYYIPGSIPRTNLPRLTSPHSILSFRTRRPSYLPTRTQPLDPTLRALTFSRPLLPRSILILILSPSSPIDHRPTTRFHPPTLSPRINSYSPTAINYHKSHPKSNPRRPPLLLRSRRPSVLTWPSNQPNNHRRSHNPPRPDYRVAAGRGGCTEGVLGTVRAGGEGTRDAV